MGLGGLHTPEWVCFPAVINECTWTGVGGRRGAILIMLQELASRILHHYTHVQGNNQSIYKQQNKPRKAGEDASVSAPNRETSERQTNKRIPTIWPHRVSSGPNDCFAQINRLNISHNLAADRNKSFKSALFFFSLSQQSNFLTSPPPPREPEVAVS